MNNQLHWENALPYGLSDLKKDAVNRYALNAADSLIGGDWIACCINGCESKLKRRRKGGPVEYCPVHGISMSSRPAFIFQTAERNLIVGRNTFHALPRKVDRRRLNSESSEDAVTWNVFTGMLAIGGLKNIFKWITGVEHDTPELYLWGNRIDTLAPAFSPQLAAIQQQLEKGKAIPTEPDIILRVPGIALVVIEAKFGSPNSLFEKKQARLGQSAFEYLSRYAPRDSATDPLNRDWLLLQSTGVLEQLCRNAVIAHWLATPNEKVFLVNLVMKDQELDVEARFDDHLLPGRVTFKRIVWEDLFAKCPLEGVQGQTLRRYAENKTLGLKKAFFQSP